MKLPYRGCIAVLFLVSGCATRSDEPRAITAVTSRVSVVTPVQDGSALRDFKPARPGVLSGGECTERKLPADTVSRYTAHFPARRNPDLLITLIVTDSGTPVRYSELRGLPRPARTPSGAMGLEDVVSTHFQLDYVTGEAMVSNRQPDEENRMIMTSVDAVASSGLLGDVQERIGTVRQVCEAAR